MTLEKAAITGGGTAATLLTGHMRSKIEPIFGTLVTQIIERAQYPCTKIYIDWMQCLHLTKSWTHYHLQLHIAHSYHHYRPPMT